MLGTGHTNLLIVALSGLVLATGANAVEADIEISRLEAAAYRADGNWGCCSPSYLSYHNDSQVGMKQCEVLGGYCMGSKQKPILTFDLSSIPEGAVIQNVRLQGTRTSPYSASGFLEFGFASSGAITTSLANAVVQNPAGTASIFWSSGSTFNYGLSAASFNDPDRDSHLVVLLQTYTTSYSWLRNDPGHEAKLVVTVDIPSCTGDLNDDGQVNAIDLGSLLSYWGTDSSSGDLSGDGLVNAEDITIMLINWGSCS